MTERFVLVTVKISTEGNRCRDWTDNGLARACPYLDSEWSRCGLFSAPISPTSRDDYGASYPRVTACLALDNELDQKAGEP